MCVLVRTGGPGLRWNEHIEGDGETIFRHTCKLGSKALIDRDGKLATRM
jgi:hypothetical protein